MSDFKAHMHQIVCRLGLRPRPRWGAYSAPPDPVTGFKAAYSKGREERGGEVGKGGEVGEGKGGEESCFMSLGVIDIPDYYPHVKNVTGLTKTVPDQFVK